jgi:iron complex transport system ATP-binding protein
VIEAEAMSVVLDGRRIVSDVTLSVPRGRWLMLIGPNGAGKSTILRALAGLLPCAGSVRLEGRALSSLGRKEVARRIAVVAQAPQLPADMTVWDYVSLGRTPHLGYLGRRSGRDDVAISLALRRLELDELSPRRLRTLSGGERQRAVLARALAQEAAVLLLDEATAELDVGRQQDVLSIVAELRRRHGLTVVGALHDLTLAGQYADELVLLDGGRVVAQGSVGDVLVEPVLNRHYRARLRVGAPRGHGLVVTPLPPVPGVMPARAPGKSGKQL